MGINGRGRYDAYLRSAAWQEVRVRAFKFYGRKCARCPMTKKLHVHHKTYERFGAERIDDLEILCESCHMIEHGRRTVQTLVGKPPQRRKKRRSKTGRKQSTGWRPAKKHKPSQKQKGIVAENIELRDRQREIKLRRQKAADLKTWEKT